MGWSGELTSFLSLTRQICEGLVYTDGKMLPPPLVIHLIPADSKGSGVFLAIVL